MVIGSGPIVIGQACEFYYSGTQAVKALRGEGPAAEGALAGLEKMRSFLQGSGVTA